MARVKDTRPLLIDQVPSDTDNVLDLLLGLHYTEEGIHYLESCVGTPGFVHRQAVRAAQVAQVGWADLQLGTGSGIVQQTDRRR